MSYLIKCNIEGCKYTVFGYKAKHPPRRQQVGMSKYSPYSCTITSAANLDAPNRECLLWSIRQFSEIPLP